MKREKINTGKAWPLASQGERAQKSLTLGLPASKNLRK